MDDDDMTTTRHHHNDSNTIGTPVTMARATLAAILAAVDTSQLSVGQAAEYNQLVAYAS